VREYSGPGNSDYDDVTATGERDAWMVGHQGEFEEEGDYVLEHWDGARWTAQRLPTGGPYRLTGVDADRADDVWVVGDDERAYAARWDGARWQAYRPPGGGGVDDVAVADGRAWLVGGGRDGGTLILGWDGSRLRAMGGSVPGVLSGVTATGKARAWAVGATRPAGDKDARPLIMRWTGTSWRRSPAPPIAQGYLEGVVELSADDAWAVGHEEANTPHMPLLLHWNGRSWTSEKAPFEVGELSGLTGGHGRPLLASGYDAGKDATAFLRYDGRRWSASYGPSLCGAPRPVAMTGIAGIPGTTATWAVGSAQCDDETSQGVIERG
jgi:hypothetical protein